MTPVQWSHVAVAALLLHFTGAREFEFIGCARQARVINSSEQNFTKTPSAAACSQNCDTLYFGLKNKRCHCLKEGIKSNDLSNYTSAPDNVCFNPKNNNTIYSIYKQNNDNKSTEVSTTISPSTGLPGNKTTESPMISMNSTRNPGNNSVDGTRATMNSTGKPGNKTTESPMISMNSTRNPGNNSVEGTRTTLNSTGKPPGNNTMEGPKTTMPSIGKPGNNFTDSPKASVYSTSPTIYSSSFGKKANSTPDVTLPSNCAPFACHSGCFKIQKTEHVHQIRSELGQQVRNCISKCPGTTYIGVQNVDMKPDEIKCFCVGKNLKQQKTVPAKRCNKTCDGSKFLCGGDDNVVSVYEVKHQTKQQMPSTGSTGVEVYVGLTIGILVVLCFLIGVGIFCFRQWRSFQESKRYEEDPYSTYTEIACNEMATSCSIEGSSNVIFLKNYPAKLPPSRKINRHSNVIENSISEQVIKETDEDEDKAKVTGADMADKEKCTKDPEEDSHYFTLEPNSSPRVDGIGNPGYLEPRECITGVDKTVNIADDLEKDIDTKETTALLVSHSDTKDVHSIIGPGDMNILSSTIGNQPPQKESEEDSHYFTLEPNASPRVDGIDNSSHLKPGECITGIDKTVNIADDLEKDIDTKETTALLFSHSDTKDVHSIIGPGDMNILSSTIGNQPPQKESDEDGQYFTLEPNSNSLENGIDSSGYLEPRCCV